MADTASVRLTPAELRVMKMVAQGKGYKAVAHDCGVSEQTVKNHMTAVRTKLDAGSVIIAMIKLGWVHSPDLGNLDYSLFKECGWVGECGRPAFHRGHHGGFREHRGET